jgi:hypothetical protein
MPFRHRFLVASLVFALVGAVASVGAASSLHATAAGKRGVAARAARAKRMTAAAKHLTRRFIATAVQRRHTVASYDLVTRHFRQGLTRKQWATGNIPVVPFDTAQIDFRKAYPGKREVYFVVELTPPADSEYSSSMPFWIGLVRAHGRWLVDYWMPACPC